MTVGAPKAWPDAETSLSVTSVVTAVTTLVVAESSTAVTVFASTVMGTVIVVHSTGSAVSHTWTR